MPQHAKPLICCGVSVGNCYPFIDPRAPTISSGSVVRPPKPTPTISSPQVRWARSPRESSLSQVDPERKTTFLYTGCGRECGSSPSLALAFPRQCSKPKTLDQWSPPCFSQSRRLGELPALVRPLNRRSSPSWMPRSWGRWAEWIRAGSQTPAERREQALGPMEIGLRWRS